MGAMDPAPMVPATMEPPTVPATMGPPMGPATMGPPMGPAMGPGSTPLTPLGPLDIMGPLGPVNPLAMGLLEPQFNTKKVPMMGPAPLEPVTSPMAYGICNTMPMTSMANLNPGSPMSFGGNADTKDADIQPGSPKTLEPDDTETLKPADTKTLEPAPPMTSGLADTKAGANPGSPVTSGIPKFGDEMSPEKPEKPSVVIPGFKHMTPQPPKTVPPRMKMVSKEPVIEVMEDVIEEPQSPKHKNYITISRRSMPMLPTPKTKTIKNANTWPGYKVDWNPSSPSSPSKRKCEETEWSEGNWGGSTSSWGWKRWKTWEEEPAYAYETYDDGDDDE